MTKMFSILYIIFLSVIFPTPSFASQWMDDIVNAVYDIGGVMLHTNGVERTFTRDDVGKTIMCLPEDESFVEVAVIGLEMFQDISTLVVHCVDGQIKIDESRSQTSKN